jgi:hypothetical protein
MKLTLFLTFLFLSYISKAQSFTQSNESQEGESLTLYVCDDTFSNYDYDSGDGVTWDFSSITADADETIKDLSIQTNSNTDFSSSTKVSSIPSFLETYWSSNVNSKSSQGFIYYTNDNSVGNFEVRFDTDEERLIDYPFSLNSSLTDSYSGTFINDSYASGGSPCSGTIASEVDAKGTLILPGNNIYENVLRHKVIETTNSTITLPIFGSTSVTVIRKQYDYYDFESSSLPLFSHIDISYDAGGFFSDQITLVLSSIAPGNQASTASVNSLSKNNSINVYPNPVKNFFRLKGDLVGSSELNIIDPNGREVLSYENVENGQLVNIEDLLPGIYYLKVYNNGYNSIVRIVIE